MRRLSEGSIPYQKQRAGASVVPLRCPSHVGKRKAGVTWLFPLTIIARRKGEITDDTLIAILVAQRTEDKYLIIYGDKDFIQLQHYGDVYQFSPLLKSFIGESSDPIVFLREQIIKGDRSDGIPNILSDDDIFLRDERQKPINKKRLAEWADTDNIPLGSETRKYFERNKKLIDLSMIPKEISESIINKYKDCKDNDRSLLLQYFIDNKLKALIENINDF